MTNQILFNSSICCMFTPICDW